jgi:DNA segregation ATPase FtsK/SpoIIIE, S-DNA-T family
MPTELDYQADQIERVLASHGVPGRVYGGAVTPRLVEFHVQPAPGIKIARIEGLAEELALYLGVSSCRIQRRGSVISIEVPKDRPPFVKLLGLIQVLQGRVPPLSAVLGQDHEGLPLVLRLPSPDVAHVLITGTTGSGKTELARTMILSLALCNRPDVLRLLLIDPKGRGYRVFAGLPHLVCPVLSDVADAQERLQGLIAEMERRDKAGESDPQIVVFVDELADLMMVGGKQMIQTMTRLTQRGREAGIHMIACTQKPTAAIVGGLAKSNFPARLVGSVASADDARIAAGIGATGAEKLTGRGDFLLIVKGEVQRLQAAYVPPQDMELAVAQLSGVHLSPIASGPGPARTPTRATVPAAPSLQEHLPMELVHAAQTDKTTATLPVALSDDDLGRHGDQSSSGDPAAQAAAGVRAKAESSGHRLDPFDWRPISHTLRIGSHKR